MRFPIIILCFIFLILEYKTVNGQLINNFFGKVHEAAEKVRQDVRKVLRPNFEQSHVNTTNNTPIFFNNQGDSGPYQVKPVSSTTVKSDVTPKPSQISTNQPEPTNDNVIFVFPDDETEPSRTGISTTSTTSKSDDFIACVTEVVPTTTTKKTSKSDDDKDSRENFSAGCLTGYVRTPDGRCIATF